MLTVGTASKSKGKLLSLQNNERTFPRIPPDCTTAFYHASDALVSSSTRL